MRTLQFDPALNPTLSLAAMMALTPTRIKTADYAFDFGAWFPELGLLDERLLDEMVAGRGLELRTYLREDDLRVRLLCQGVSPKVLLYTGGEDSGVDNAWVIDIDWLAAFAGEYHRAAARKALSHSQISLDDALPPVDGCCFDAEDGVLALRPIRHSKAAVLAAAAHDLAQVRNWAVDPADHKAQLLWARASYSHLGHDWGAELQAAGIAPAEPDAAYKAVLDYLDATYPKRA